jgi:DNA-binding transcriptional ArsR family regulator
LPEREALDADSELLSVLQALADPSRLRIVLMLREREQCVCHLTEALSLSQGTVSHHMSVLKKAGLVRDRRDSADGRWVYYSLDPSAREIGRRMADLLDGSQMDRSPADCTDR